MQWLQDNATLLSAFATIFMAIVWIVYAQVAIRTYLRHRKPRIIIDQTEEQSIDTKFIIVNLSEQPVYVANLIVSVGFDGQERSRQVSKYFRSSSEDVHERPREVESELRHGTLTPGDLLLLGDTDQLLTWLMSDDGDEDTPHGEKFRQMMWSVDVIEIRAISMVGVEDEPIGSYRRFEVVKDDHEVAIRPKDAYTHHLTSRRNRKIVAQWTEDSQAT